MISNLLDRYGCSKPETIEMQTSKRNPIKNEQYFEITQLERNNALGCEHDFKSNYIGEPSRKYNCHGLTFASKRTGIYEDAEIIRILEDEYIEIKSPSLVIVGDIVIYYSLPIISHSALVVQVENNAIPLIKVLSKTRDWKEIVHNVHDSPYKQLRDYEIKYFRINHGQPVII